MKILLALLLASGVCTKVLKLYPYQFYLPGSATSENEIPSSDPISEERRKEAAMEFLSRYYKFQQHHQNQLGKAFQDKPGGVDLLLLKNQRQRNKRYSGYTISYCHYKLCQLGRKRTAKFLR